MDNARERRFGNGERPASYGKIMQTFIAILLQSGGGSEGKDRDSPRGSAMAWSSALDYAVVTTTVS